jgi:predicted ATPase
MADSPYSNPKAKQRIHNIVTDQLQKLSKAEQEIHEWVKMINQQINRL